MVSSTVAHRGSSMGDRLVGEADAPLDRVRVADQPGGEVEDADVDDLGVEDLLDLVADDVVDRLHLELARERLLHAVDQRQLGVPLPRLVHQPRVLERHAEAAGERLQQLLVGLGEGVLAVDVLQRDHAASALPPLTSGTKSTDFGGSPPSTAGCRTARPSRRRSRRSGAAARVSITCLRKPISSIGSSAEPLAALDDVREVEQPRRLVVDRDVDDLRVEDLPDLVADGVVDRLRARARRRARPARC